MVEKWDGNQVKLIITLVGADSSKLRENGGVHGGVLRALEN